MSRHAARSANPDAHLRYSGRVDGHKGTRCWYADFGHVSPRAAAQSRPPRLQSHSTGVPGRTVGSIPATGATAYAPLPHEIVSETERFWAAILRVALTPQERIENTFDDVGWK